MIYMGVGEGSEWYKFMFFKFIFMDLVMGFFWSMCFLVCRVCVIIVGCVRMGSVMV